MKRAMVVAGALAMALPTAGSAQEGAGVVADNIALYKARDMEGFLSTFAPDACVIAHGITACGHARIRAFYALNFRPVAPEVTVRGFRPQGDQVIVRAAYDYGQGRVECCSTSRYQVRGGKIVRLVVD